MNIGERIKEERERLGFDQVGFAALGGASRHSQIDWEKGKSFPNAQVLAAFATAGADVQYILTGTRTQPTQLSERQKALLDNYQHTDEQGKKIIEATASAASEPTQVKKQAS